MADFDEFMLRSIDIHLRFALANMTDTLE